MDLERILFLTEGSVSAKEGFLHLKKADGTLKKVALTDIAAIVFEGYEFNLSLSIFQEASKRSIFIVINDEKFKPACSLNYPFTHINHLEILKRQMEKDNSEIFVKLIRQKIINQKETLRQVREDIPKGNLLILERMAENLTYKNIFIQEAQAAKHYWRNLFEDRFKREKRGAEDPINSRLNFGYAIIRSYLSRYLYLTGLHPGIGVGHKNSKNPYCLSDDLMEPFRPLVDGYVAKLDYQEEFGTPESKKEMLEILDMEVEVGGRIFSLSTACREVALSFSKTLTDDKFSLNLPRLILV